MSSDIFACLFELAFLSASGNDFRHVGNKGVAQIQTVCFMAL